MNTLEPTAEYVGVVIGRPNSFVLHIRDDVDASKPNRSSYPGRIGIIGGHIEPIDLAEEPKIRVEEVAARRELRRKIVGLPEDPNLLALNFVENLAFTTNEMDGPVKKHIAIFHAYIGGIAVRHRDDGFGDSENNRLVEISYQDARCRVWPFNRDAVPFVPDALQAVVRWRLKVNSDLMEISS